MQSTFLLAATNFTWLDWVIVGVYLSLSLVIGMFVKRYTNSMVNYLGAGRAVGPWLGIATMTGTELGLVTVMYSAQKGFSTGFAAFHIAVIAGAVTLLVGLTGFIIVPLRRTRVLTIPEYYEMRYGRSVRIVGGIVLATAGILNMGMFLKVGSLFIVVVTGLDADGWALPLVMTTLLVMVLAYTTMGGMVSVIITDYVQFVVLSLGLVATSFFAIYKLGWNNIFQTVADEMQVGGFSPIVNDNTGSSYIVWMGVLGLVSCGVWPTALARALAMESEKAVQKQYIWSSLSFMVRFLIPAFWGICALVYFANNPELYSHFLDDPDADTKMLAMPTFIAQLLPTGALGFIAAAMIAAFMSTHDSYLLCWSSVITQDIIAPISGKMSDASRLRCTRIFIWLIGLFILFWGLFYKAEGELWDYMAITGAIYFTGAIPILVGGLYWSRASSAGAMGALISGSIAILGLKPIHTRLELLFKQLMGMSIEEIEKSAQLLTEARIGIFTVAVTCCVFIVVSLMIPDPEQNETKPAR